MTNPPKQQNNAFWIVAAVLAAGAIGFVLWQNNAPKPSASPEAVKLIGLGGSAILDRPTLGEPTAKIQVTVFEDFKCPNCKRYGEQVFPQMRDKYINTGKIRYTFLNYPFLAADSKIAALAAMCVHKEDPTHFWEYEEIIFRAQKDEKEAWVTPEYLTQIAENVSGLDTQKLKQCIADKRYEKEVDADKALLEQLLPPDQLGTPAVFVNGKKVDARAIDDFLNAVEDALKSS
ncbi:MAG: thioredoxin domain-containing protein [Deinococcaceae bacterium]